MAGLTAKPAISAPQADTRHPPFSRTNGLTLPAIPCPASRAKPMVSASAAGPSAPCSGLPPSVFSMCSADQFSAAFSVRKAISTIPPPTTGSRPSPAPPGPLGRARPWMRPSRSHVARAQTSAAPARAAITSAGGQPAPRMKPVATAPPA